MILSKIELRNAFLVLEQKQKSKGGKFMYQFVFSEKERKDMVESVEKFDNDENIVSIKEKDDVIDGQTEISLYDLKSVVESDNE